MMIQSLRAALAACLCAAATLAAAQTSPVKPIRIVVPAPPGGSLDLRARTNGKMLENRLRTQFPDHLLAQA
jgi:tripartite-type tricarboxylate transporter receptor subunit TctC